MAVIGTHGTDFANAVAINSAGEAFVAGVIGYTEEPFFTLGAYQAAGPAHSGAYLMKFAPNGTLLFAARLGSIWPQALALDPSGDIVVAGLASATFAVTPGAVDVGTGQSNRALIMKLSADGSTLLYAARLGAVVNTGSPLAAGTYWGPAGPALRVEVDGEDRAYVSGTALPGFPATPGAYRTAVSGASDAFVAKLSADGTTLVYSTLLGGSGADEGHGLAIDAVGGAIVGGTTPSADFPSTTVLHDGWEHHAFVARISPDGSALDFASRISGERGAHARDVALGPTGDIYLTGVTRSMDFPVYPATSSRFDFDWRAGYGGRFETFVVRLTPDAAGLVYSTSLLDPGDNEDSYGHQGSAMAIAIDVDSAGRALVVGGTRAGHNWHLDIPLSFSEWVEADGSRLRPRAVIYSHGDWGSAAYDVAVNEHGDTAIADNTNNWMDVSGHEPTYGKDPFYPYSEDDESGWMGGTDGRVFWTVAARPPNTPAGGPVTVPAAGGDASVSFGAVTAGGTTTVVPVDAASLDLTLPGGFALSGSSQAYEIRTTATVSGIQVCLSGAGLSDADFASAVILHGVGGEWQVEATTRNTETRQLCATVDALSPFAVGVRLDVTAPVVACGPAPSTWSADNVGVQCTAADAGVGLALAADAAFTLTTTVPAGAETANAFTGTREICDLAGNCANAGPLGPIPVDRLAPVVGITSPVSGRYHLHEAVTAAYACSDGGQLASCVGTVAIGEPIDTATPGAKTFSVQASDAAGHTSMASVSYSVGYGVEFVLERTRSVKRGRPLLIDIRLVDAAGVNVSSPAIVVTVLDLRLAASGTPISPQGLTPPDGTFRFVASGRYSYGLVTKDLAPGTYELRFTAGQDPFAHTVSFVVTP